MKETLALYAAYNHWANHLITQTILNLPEEKQLRELPGSFPGLLPTIIHIWDAESIWWQRMKLQEKLIVPSVTFNPNMHEAVHGLLLQSAQWESWVMQASEKALSHVFAYQNTRKEQFKQPVSEMVMHVFNHGTYHRGQLVNMLRAVGETKIPATDFIVYARKKKKL